MLGRRRLVQVLAFLGALHAGGAVRSSWGPEAARPPSVPEGPVVQLRCERLPALLAPFAVHSYFVLHDPTDGPAWHRYEVWAPGDEKGNMVRRDLFPAGVGVLGHEPWVEHEWRGREAIALLATLERSREHYPHRGTYVFWPGPNCNTYAAWVLTEAAVSGELPPQAVGKDYLGLWGARVATERTGVQVESPIAGVAVGLAEGVQVHFFELTFGVHVWPPALETPVGRIGIAPSRR